MLFVRLKKERQNIICKDWEKIHDKTLSEKIEKKNDKTPSAKIE